MGGQGFLFLHNFPQECLSDENWMALALKHDSFSGVAVSGREQSSRVMPLSTT